MDTKALRQKMLDLAIRGKLVPQDPNDEPASVLLERIRQQKQQMVKEGKLKAKDIKNDSIIFVGEDNLHYEKFADGSVKCIEDEIPLDLPEGWAWERLSNLAAFSGGKTPSTSRREYWDGEVLWVTSKDMKSKYITSSQLRLSALGAEQMQVYQPDTLLLVTRSGILRHTLPIAILKECATVNQDLKAIVLYMPELAEYIYVCLKGMETQLLLKYTKSGTTVENVNFDEFRKVLLPIAPLHEVGKIIAATNDATQIVSAIEDDKVALAEYVARAKAKILDLAIRGQLVPQDPNDEPASVLLERIRAEKEELIRQGKIKRDKKESVIFRGEDNSYYEKIGGKVVNIDDEIPFELPDSWFWCRLGNIGDWQTGATPNRRKPEYYEGAIPWIKTGDLNNGYITEVPEAITELALAETSVKVIPSNTVIVAMYGATIGKVGITTFESTTNQACCACCNPQAVRGKYLFYYLMSHKDVFVSMAEGGAQPNISKEKIVATLIPIPPYDEQTRITKIVEASFSILDRVEKSLS